MGVKRSGVMRTAEEGVIQGFPHAAAAYLEKYISYVPTANETAKTLSILAKRESQKEEHHR